MNSVPAAKAGIFVCDAASACRESRDSKARCGSTAVAQLDYADRKRYSFLFFYNRNVTSQGIVVLSRDR